MGVGIIFPCADCGARDSRDESHQQGCPYVPPLSDAALMRIARNVERLWADSGYRRAEREQDAARSASVRGNATAAYRRPSKGKREALPPVPPPVTDASGQPERREVPEPVQGLRVRDWLGTWRPRPAKAKGAAR